MRRSPASERMEGSKAPSSSSPERIASFICNTICSYIGLLLALEITMSNETPISRKAVRTALSRCARTKRPSPGCGPWMRLPQTKCIYPISTVYTHHIQLARWPAAKKSPLLDVRETGIALSDAKRRVQPPAMFRQAIAQRRPCSDSAQVHRIGRARPCRDARPTLPTRKERR